MKFVNDRFFELTGHTHAPVDQFEWFNLIADEDVERVKQEWVNMLDEKKSDGVQFRLKKTWVNQDGICSNIWVQSSSYPELDDNGKVISMYCTLEIREWCSPNRCYGHFIRHFAVQMGRKRTTPADRGSFGSKATAREVCHTRL